MTKRKLEFELVPDGCWGYNLRSILSKAQWEYLRQQAINNSSGTCSICGKKTSRLHAHERWEYDGEKGVQKLIDIVAVCPDCHSAIHIGREQLLGNAERAEDHYMKVNGISYAEMKNDLARANEKHKQLNKVSEWVLDLSFLKKFLNL